MPRRPTHKHVVGCVKGVIHPNCVIQLLLMLRAQKGEASDVESVSNRVVVG